MPNWNNWHKKYLDLAFYVAQWSKDPNKKVGAVAVSCSDHRQTSLGFNGLPVGMSNELEILNDRQLKLRYIIHAEVNALTNASFDTDDCYLYSTLFPCYECAKFIRDHQVKMVITKSPDWSHPRWGESFIKSSRLLRESGVEILFLD